MSINAMPLWYTIDPDARLVTLRYEGDVTFEEWADVMCAAFRDPLFNPGFGFLADRRASPAVSTGYIRRVVTFAKAHEAELGKCRWATVVSTPSAYGMARMTQGLGQDIKGPFEVFNDIDAALRWLREGGTEGGGQEGGRACGSKA